MAPTAVEPAQGRSIREVLAAGGRLFTAGLLTVFPWVLAAELTVLLPFAGKTGNLLDTDIGQLVQVDSLLRELLIGLVQAVLYGIAVLRLAELAGGPIRSNMAWSAVRAAPAVFIGYIAYEILLIVGISLALLIFMLGVFVLGLWPGLVICTLVLAPTAIVSTALALFVFPAVLDRRGPFEALGESARLARSSWARVSLVVSVPALVFLVLWIGENGKEVMDILRASLELLQRAQEGASAEELQALLPSLKLGSESHGLIRRFIDALLGALSWWYALVVCYAQYRDLKLRAEARSH